MTKIKPKAGVNADSAPVFLKAHIQACENNEDSYIDPETGFHVLTSYYLKSRGHCCTNKCRHCPYGFHPEAWPFDKDEVKEKG